MLAEIDLLLVSARETRRIPTGSSRSRARALPSYLIDDEVEVDERWLEGVRTVGVTSGASAPEELVSRSSPGSGPVASSGWRVKMVDEDVASCSPPRSGGN